MPASLSAMLRAYKGGQGGRASMVLRRKGERITRTPTLVGGKFKTEEGSF